MTTAVDVLDRLATVRVRRILVVVGAGMALSVIAPLTTSIAHPIRSFEACAARSRTTATCLRQQRYILNESVYLRGKVTPAHAGFRAAVLQLDPGSNVWISVDGVRVSETGRMRWRWETTFHDADRHHPYTFKFEIFGHPRASDVVRTWVLFRDQQ
jgi:hypothetical protein